MSDFRWDREEDEWREPVELRPPPERPGARRRGRLALVVVAALLLAVTLTVRRQVQRGVRAVEDDVRRSVVLALEAAARGDDELLRTLLDEQPARWFVAQAAAARAGGWPGGAAVDWRPTGGPVQVDVLALGGELDSAEIHAHIPVTTPDATAPFTVTLPLHLRRGDTRWLITAPPADYWGPTESIIGRRVTVSYPRRDAATALWLGEKLDAALTALCEPARGFDCPVTFRLALTLSPAIDAVSGLDPLAPYQPSRAVTLPTPSLVGVPQDAAGEAALLDDYARRALTPALALLTGYSCCEHVLYLATLARHALAEVGVAQWPLDSADYATLLRDDDIAFSLRVDVGWDVTDPTVATAEQWREAQAIVDFIYAADPALTLDEPLSELGERSQRFVVWLGELMRLHTPGTGLGQNWQPPTPNLFPGSDLDQGNAFLYRYLNERAGGGAAAPPVAHPNGELVLACSTDGATALWHYNPATDEWREAARLDDAGIQRVWTLPHQSAVWVEQWRSDGSANYLWDGQTLQQVRERALFFEGRVSPDGNLLALSEWDGERRDYVLSLRRCLRGDCGLERVDGPLVWSPDGRYRVVWPGAAGEMVRLEDGTGAALETFAADFVTLHWLDATTPAWWDADGLRLVVRDVADGVTRGVVSAESLAAALPPTVNQGVRVIAMVANPVDPDQVFLTVLVDAIVDLNYVVTLDRQTGAVTWLETVGQAGFFPADNAGPYVTGTRNFHEGQRPHVLLYNAATGAVTTYPVRSTYLFPATGDWHVDGTWLALAGAGYVRLLAPDLNVDRLVFPPGVACTSAAWLSN